MTETVLQYKRLLYQCFGKYLQIILRSSSTNAFWRTYIFKDMNFSEPFQTVILGLLSNLVVRIINKMIFFVSYFPFPSKFLWLWRNSFNEIFRIRRKKNSLMDSIFCYAASLRKWDVFLQIFCNFPITKSVKQRLLLSFMIFLWKLFNGSFFLFQAICLVLVFYQKLLFKNVTLNVSI